MSGETDPKHAPSGIVETAGKGTDDVADGATAAAKRVAQGTTDAAGAVKREAELTGDVTVAIMEGVARAGKDVSEWSVDQGATALDKTTGVAKDAAGAAGKAGRTVESGTRKAAGKVSDTAKKVGKKLNPRNWW